MELFSPSPGERAAPSPISPMGPLRVALIWAVAWWAQLVLAPMLRWLQGFPDVVFLAWLAVALHLRGRSFWFWTLLWGLSVGWISALPDLAMVLPYLALGWALHRLREHMWERTYPLLFGSTLVGTMALCLWEYAVLQLTGTGIPWAAALSQVVVPTLWWNLLLALPVFTVVSGLAGPRRVET